MAEEVVATGAVGGQPLKLRNSTLNLDRALLVKEGDGLTLLMVTNSVTFVVKSLTFVVKSLTCVVKLCSPENCADRC